MTIKRVSFLFEYFVHTASSWWWKYRAFGKVVGISFNQFDTVIRGPKSSNVQGWANDRNRSALTPLETSNTTDRGNGNGYFRSEIQLLERVGYLTPFILMQHMPFVILDFFFRTARGEINLVSQKLDNGRIYVEWLAVGNRGCLSPCCKSVVPKSRQEYSEITKHLIDKRKVGIQPRFTRF